MSLRSDVKGMATDHAMVRYMERVEGYDFTEIREEIEEAGLEVSDYMILNILSQKYGLTRGHIAYKVMRKPVILAVRAGAKQYRKGDHVWVIGDGKVVTIEPRHSVSIKSERKTRLTGKAKKIKETVNGKKYVWNKNRRVKVKYGQRI